MEPQPQPLPIPARRDPRTFARLIVTCTVSFLDEKGHATSAQVRYGGKLESGEQPYLRVLTLTEGWQDLDLGWLAEKALSMLVLKCESGIAQVRMKDGEKPTFDWAIPEGLALVGTPAAGIQSLLQLRGPGRVTITAIPK